MLTRISLLWIVLLASSCIASRIETEKSPSAGYRYGELIAHETFDSRGEWRNYQDADKLIMDVVDGVYRINLSQKQYVWTQAPIEHDDVVIEATITYGADFTNFSYGNFGVICRANAGNSGRGYYFLISADGYYTIRWGNGRSLDDIIPASPSSAIKTGRATNIIRVVCVDDYLALWINDKFVAEAHDKKSSSGVVGLAGMMAYVGQNLSVDFDDVKVWDSEYLAKSS